MSEEQGLEEVTGKTDFLEGAGEAVRVVLIWLVFYVMTGCRVIFVK
jgi:hypothetical protein